MTDSKIKVLDIVIMSLLTALLFIVQIAFAWLPNIELVSLLVMVYSVVYGKKVFPIIIVFNLLEAIVFGLGIWVIAYMYIWPILAIISMFMRKVELSVFWAVMSGGFGLIFGALSAIPYFFMGGPSAMLAYWVNGIPFDVVHCIGNFLITLLAFKPCVKVLRKLDTSIKR